MSESGDEMDALTSTRSERPEQSIHLEPVGPPSGRQIPDDAETVFALDDLGVSYRGARAVEHVSLDIYEHQITALIGPSGCGKTTVVRCLNRMNDLIDGALVEGTVRYHGVDLYDSGIDPV